MSNHTPHEPRPKRRETIPRPRNHVVPSSKKIANSPIIALKQAEGEKAFNDAMNLWLADNVLKSEDNPYGTANIKYRILMGEKP